MADALLVTSSFLPGHGGIESYLAEICTQLAPRLAVMAPASRGSDKLPTDLDYETIPGPGSMLVPRKEVADAVVAHALRLGTKKVLFGTPWPLILIAPRLQDAGLTYASIVHGSELFVPAAAPILRNRLAHVLADADALFPVSDFTASKIESLLERYSLSPPTIGRLYARVDTDRFRPDVDTAPMRAELGISENDKVVVCFGRLVKRKGVDRAIAALPEIAERVGPTTLVIAGTGPEDKRLRSLAARTPARVVFAGRVPDSDAPATYALADVFVLPVADRYLGLDTEGLGVVLLEAAACGVPCVTGRSGGTTEAVVDGVTGFVIEGHDRGELVESVARLLKDDSLKEKMGKAGREHIVTHFSTEPPSPLLQWLGEA
jgi:phosphatidyl-myo-inositol dimannoside synthase